MSLPLNCTLLCASGAAYDINSATGQYKRDPVFSKAVAYSTDPTPIGTELAKLITEAAGWDYRPVGAELFIESAFYGYQINTNETAPGQILDLMWNLAQNLGSWATALENAHGVGCGNGYMNGNCPASVCDGSSTAV